MKKKPGKHSNSGPTRVLVETIMIIA